MKALLCTQFGPADLLELCDMPSPTPGARQVVVAVKAASVNFPDVLIIENKYQFKPALPFSPGNEFAGVVKAVGAEVTGVRRGDRVMALVSHGAFAEEVAVDAERVVPMPEAMDFPEAASLLLTYGTADHALRDRGATRPEETVLVLGAAGGVGIAAVEIAKAVGARVIACASTDAKLRACREHGADEVINYATENLRDRIKALTAGNGPDVIVDPVGGPFTELALRSIAWRGRLLVVGFTAGEIPKVPLNLPLLKGCAIVGVFWGDLLRREPQSYAASVQQLIQWHAEGRLKPHIAATYPLARAGEAIKRMASRESIGKLVVAM